MLKLHCEHLMKSYIFANSTVLNHFVCQLIGKILIFTSQISEKEVYILTNLPTWNNFRRTLPPVKNWTFSFMVHLKFLTKNNFLFSLKSVNKYSLSVCLCPINVKTAEPIGPKFFVGPHVTPGKVYEWSKF